jgi:hypothetical protein
MKKINYETLVADLIQELINLGYNTNDLIFTLTQYGFTEKQIKEYYGIPYDEEEAE